MVLIGITWLSSVVIFKQTCIDMGSICQFYNLAESFSLGANICQSGCIFFHLALTNQLTCVAK